MRSITVTRGSERKPPVELPVGDVDGATTCAAPRWSRQSVNPPVEAPTSSAWRPATRCPSASSALASLIPPRETNAGALAHLHLDVLGDQLAGLLGPAALGQEHHLAGEHRGGRPDRDANTPRSESRLSSRTRCIVAGTVRDHGRYVIRPAARKM